MPYYTLNRNHLHRSTSGVVSFEKGKPTWVVPMMEKEVVAIGAERADGENPDVLEPELPVRKIFGPIERQDEIFAAFSLIVERNEPKDFTGAGVPTVKAVEKIVDKDMEVDRNEIVEMWAEYKTAQAEGK